MKSKRRRILDVCCKPEEIGHLEVGLFWEQLKNDVSCDEPSQQYLNHQLSDIRFYQVLHCGCIHNFDEITDIKIPRDFQHPDRCLQYLHFWGDIFFADIILRYLQFGQSAISWNNRQLLKFDCHLVKRDCKS